jgi:Ran GTPase-activating protein (RanGAP) involved in mRNA processing and transport
VLERLLKQVRTLFIGTRTVSDVKQLFDCGFSDASCTVRELNVVTHVSDVSYCVLEGLKKSHLHLERLSFPLPSDAQFLDAIEGLKKEISNLNCFMQLKDEVAMGSLTHFLGPTIPNLSTLKIVVRSNQLLQFAAAVASCESLTDLNFRTESMPDNETYRVEFCQHFGNKRGAPFRRFDTSLRGFTAKVAFSMTRALASSTALTSLHLEHLVDVRDEECASSFITQMTALTNLSLQCVVLTTFSASELANVLQSAPGLTRLDLSYSSIPNSALLPIRDNLRHSTSLQILELCGCELRAEEAEFLAEGMKHNSSIRSLDLSYNDLGDSGTAALAECAKNHATLQQLRLWRIRAEDQGAAALAEALRKNHKIKEIDLLESFTSLLPILNPPSLAAVTVLSVMNSAMDTVAAIAIGKILKGNKSIRTLRMGTGKIGDEGAIAVAEGVSHNSTLEILDLSRLEIGSKGCLALAEMLRVNRTLLSLDLRTNQADTQSLHALAVAVLNDDVLRYFLFPDWDRKDAVSDDLQELLSTVALFKAQPSY